MLRIAIVEDYAADAQTLVQHLEHYKERTGSLITYTCFSDGRDFIDNYQPVFDIIFMDVEMNGLDGFSTSRKLRELDSAVVLVFVTNLAQYAIKGYEVEALDYLIKPVPYEHFQEVLSKAIRNLPKKAEYYKHVMKGGVVKIALSDIHYVESQGHFMNFYTKQGENRIRTTMAEVERQLPAKKFVYANRAFLVNLDYVEKIKNNTVIVEGKEIALSRMYKKKFLSALAVSL